MPMVTAALPPSQSDACLGPTAPPADIESAAKKWRAAANLMQCGLTNMSLMRMCVMAIDDGDGDLPGDPDVLLPAEFHAFIALAKRTGLKRHGYTLFMRWTEGRDFTVAPVVRAPIDVGAGRTGLYRLFDAADALLYIGISDDLRGRMRAHAQEQPWWPEVDHRTVAWYNDRDEADDAETLAIAAEKPMHNKAKRYNPRSGSAF